VQLGISLVTIATKIQASLPNRDTDILYTTTIGGKDKVGPVLS
jgi:hypothetical protein